MAFNCFPGPCARTRNIAKEPRGVQFSTTAARVQARVRRLGHGCGEHIALWLDLVYFCTVFLDMASVNDLLEVQHLLLGSPGHGYGGGVGE